MKLIVGLGNPGSEYAKTRHNIGFMVVDRIATRHGFTGLRHRFHAGVLTGLIAEVPCLLMQPTTYMNRSGTAVAEALAFYKLDLANLIVIVDDIALACGRIRMRQAGSAGGHNGLLDIETKLRTDSYPRLRVGIDSPASVAGEIRPQITQHDYVLGRFTPNQFEALQPAVERACDAVECWLTDGIDKAMSLHNAP